jgi:hypothetical protein
VMHASLDVAGRLETGAPVQFISDDARGEPADVTLSRVSGSYDPRTRMMRTEVDLPNARDPETGMRPLRAGGYGTATITLSSATLPAAPESVLVDDPVKGICVVIIKNNICHITPVEVAVTTDGMVGVADGVKPGDRVIASDADKLKDGQELTAGQLKDLAW